MAAFCMLALSLTQGQTYNRPEWLLVTQIAPGLELIYRGNCTEQSLIPGVQYQRQYAIEAIFFVHTLGADHGDAVLQTSVSMIEPRNSVGKDASNSPGSVRLDLVRIDRKGRLHPIGDADLPLSISLNGPALLESGAFFETPTVPIRDTSCWEEFEDHRPLRSWRVLGTELYRGVGCVKLECTQQSPDWKNKRADSTAWRRQDVVWFAPQVGLTFRVERTIERRDPARTEPTRRIKTVYDLESMFRYEGRLFDDRKEEIARARKFQDDARPFLSQPAGFRPQIEALLGRVTDYMGHNPPNPYRKALVHLQARLNRARSGDVPVLFGAAAEVPKDMDRAPLSIGQKVPDFAISDLSALSRDNSRRFHAMLGKPILMLYYDPTTETGKEVLRFAQKLHEKFDDEVLVFGMAISDDLALIRRQYEEFDLSFAILDGKAMLRTFGVDGTPRIIVLDGEGLLSCAFTGWGYQSPDEITAALRRCGAMVPSK